MDYEYAAEEFIDERSNYYYTRRRRSVSENEPKDLLPHDLFPQTSNQSSMTPQVSQVASPARPESASSNGCHLSADADYHGSRSKGGSRKIGDWLSSSQRQRRVTADDNDVEMAEPDGSETEFRRRSGSHGIRDLLRIRPRCHSHGEKRDADGAPLTPARGGNGHGGNGATLSPGTSSSGASPGASKFRVFLDAFRHRAHSDSMSSNHAQLHGLYDPTSELHSLTYLLTTNSCRLWFL